MQRDYLLIARPAAQVEDSFEWRFEKALEAARSKFPEIQWRAGFTLGPKDRVEVFSAPASDEAMKVSHLVGMLGGLRAEVVPLRSSW